MAPQPTESPASSSFALPCARGGPWIVVARLRLSYAPSMSGAGRRDGGAARHPDAEAGSEALRRLKSGESTLDDYLDHRADLGVAHLRGMLNAEQLRAVRETIREQLVTDPVIADLIASLTDTGSAPVARE
jgi:hypothetical protein